MAYWLFKTEPDSFSIDTLKATGRSCWEGVRNYQARNMLRDQVAVGDEVLIYHSSCKQVGIVGVAKVVSEAYPDHFQFDATSELYDAKSAPENPRWWMVDIAYERHLRLIPLAKLKAIPALSEMPLVKKGSRLSVMPVSDSEWSTILSLTGKPSN